MVLLQRAGDGVNPVKPSGEGAPEQQEETLWLEWGSKACKRTKGAQDTAPNRVEPREIPSL